MQNILREAARDKAVKLLLKICENIMNSPSIIEKYGNLNSAKIHSKLSRCKPALDLLLIVGFKLSNNNQRLIWSNTWTNRALITNLHDRLQMMEDKKLISDVDLSSISQNVYLRHGFNNDEVSSIAMEDWMKGWYFKCKCGKPMKIKMGQSTKCDVCGQQNGALHCMDRSSHTNGYHLCFDCSKASMCNVDPSKNKIINSVNPSAKRGTRQCICFGATAAKSEILIQNCECLSRVISALNRYQSLHQNIEDELSRCVALGIHFDEEYNSDQFLNDYNHMIFIHSKHLEDINEHLDECVLSECKLTRYNDRVSDYGGDVANFKLLFLMELLDTAHHWLYHQFDIGMRIRRDVLCSFDEKEDEDDTSDAKFAKIRHHIKQIRKSSNLKRHRNLNSKYNLKINKTKAFQNDHSNTTFIEELSQQLQDEEIPTTAVNAFKSLIQNEEYDSECIVPDIIDYENGSNIINYVNNQHFTQFVKEYAADLRGIPFPLVIALISVSHYIQIQWLRSVLDSVGCIGTITKTRK